VGIAQKQTEIEGIMITNRLISMIKMDETIGGKPNLKPYRCSKNKLTIGYGRNLEDRGITAEEAEYLYQNDLALAERDARILFRNFDNISEARQAVLINMSFNLGKSRLAGFKKFIAAVEAENWQLAEKEMLDSKWAKDDVPKRAKRLANIMQRGEW
jgi:lysozyme